MSKPRISVIVSVDHRDVLARSIAALGAQTLPPSEFEVLVVDGHQFQDWAPRLPELVAATGKPLNIALHKIAGGSRARTNNTGIRLSTADVVLFTADDFLMQPALLEAHVRFHETHPDFRAVGVGPGFFSPELRRHAFTRWLEDSGELLGVSFTAGEVAVPPSFFYVGNCSVKRALLEQAGIFDEDFPYDAWEDYELGVRLAKHGMRAMYVPEAAAIHDHDYSLAERRVSMRNAGESAAIFARKYPGPHAWQHECRYAPWRLELAAQWWLIKSLVQGDSQARGRYYHLTLQRNFVAAYRRHAGEPHG